MIATLCTIKCYSNLRKSIIRRRVYYTLPAVLKQVSWMEVVPYRIFWSEHSIRHLTNEHLRKAMIQIIKFAQYGAFHDDIQHFEKWQTGENAVQNDDSILWRWWCTLRTLRWSTSSHVIIFWAKASSNITVQSRLAKVRDAGRCINCLASNHALKDCKSSKCRECDRAHYTMLHFGNVPKLAGMLTSVTEDMMENHVFLGTVTLMIQKCNIRRITSANRTANHRLQLWRSLEWATLKQEK